MRTVTWCNAFAKSFKRWMRKRPDMHKDIAEALGLLVVNPFALNWRLTSLRKNSQDHGHAVRDTICVSYSIL